MSNKAPTVTVLGLLKEAINKAPSATQSTAIRIDLLLVQQSSSPKVILAVT